MGLGAWMVSGWGEKAAGAALRGSGRSRYVDSIVDGLWRVAVAPVVLPQAGVALGALVPFSKLLKGEFVKPLGQKVYRSLAVVATAPWKRGSHVRVEGCEGVVRSAGLWFVCLRSVGRAVYVPTSYFYDKPVTIYEN